MSTCNMMMKQRRYRENHLNSSNAWVVKKKSFNLSRQIEAFNPMSPQGIFVYQCSIERTMLNNGVIVCNHYNLCQYFCIHLKDVVLQENVEKTTIFLLKQNLYLS